MLLLGLLPTLKREAHTDEAWALYLAGRVMDGARAGLDFVEVNPPLYIWKAIPAVAVERALGVPSWPVHVLITSAIAAACLVLAARLLRAAEPDSNGRAVLGLVMGFCALMLARTDYSQREHVALLLTLPFTTLGTVRAQSRTVSNRSAMAAGVLGAIGFSLKPHFLLPWLLLEGWLLRRRASAWLARPELRSLVVTGLVYGAAILVFAPEYLPLVRRLAPVYQVYQQRPLVEVLRLAGAPLLLTGVIAVAGWILGPRKDGLFQSYLLMHLGFLLAAVTQLKGFPYHFLGAWGYGLLALTRIIQVGSEGLRSTVLMSGALAMLLAVPALKTFDAVRELIRPEDQRYRHNFSYPSLLPLTRQFATGETVAVFSTSPSAAWPLIADAGARAGFRYMSLWPMAAFYNDQLWRPEGLVRPNPVKAGFEAEFLDEVVQDLLRNRPHLLLVLRSDSTLGLPGSQRFEYLEYFSADPRFAAFLDHYSRMQQSSLYDVWLRKPP
jgi:hypothetical protein